MSLEKEVADRPFESLQDKTLESLGSWERLSQSDREAVEKEKAYRAETQTQKTDETKSPVEDFKEHGFRLDKSEDGIKVAVPTEFSFSRNKRKNLREFTTRLSTNITGKLTKQLKIVKNAKKKPPSTTLSTKYIVIFLINTTKMGT